MRCWPNWTPKPPARTGGSGRPTAGWTGPPDRPSDTSTPGRHDPDTGPPPPRHPSTPPPGYPPSPWT
ncbi:MAG: hypothetical protein EA422_13340 [Gemmatimonadales bacterium]|nr:MAG: hypothetical protein EA422_13340 [Gemmatimonadales bacterium]